MADELCGRWNAGPSAVIEGDTIMVDLWFPRLGDHPRYVEVGLCDVRAADNIRIHYDFDRDGWAIEQARFFEWESDDACDPGWTEVAFIRAWQLDTRNEE